MTRCTRGLSLLALFLLVGCGADAPSNSPTMTDMTPDVPKGPPACQPTEEACDGADNDCDGVIDEGCACDFLDVNAGVCATAVLADDATCDTPDAYESNEIACDGLDNDCDGVIDEACSCDFRDLAAGVCAGSARDAADGACAEPATHEADELACDGLDNDCDGVVDEGCACDHQDLTVGVCAGSSRSSTDGSCEVPALFEAQETACDGQDNDCDGATDEGCGCEFMGSGMGVCAGGIIDADMCLAPALYEADETACDGQDNDCDGVVDEACPCDFGGKAAGVCATSKVDVTTGQCTSPNGFQGTEAACDGEDNDCDGVTDEACPCDFNMTNTGVCAQGTVDTGSGVCRPPASYQAGELACDGQDNDCDGITDEGCSCDFNAVTRGVCLDGAIEPVAGMCAAPMTFEADESTCDSLDNDCDGEVDEGCPRVPVAGDLIFTEVMADPTAALDEDGEWFELYNSAPYPVVLTGLKISDDSPNRSLTIAGAPALPPGAYFVFGRSASPAVNGGVRVDYAQQEFLLNNASDSLTLTAGGVVIDAVVYTSMWPGGPGVSMKLSGPTSSYDAGTNDVQASWCAGGAGTPGADNGPC